MPRLITRRVKLKAACAALACSESTYERKWQRVFTDARSPEDRRERCARLVLEDELSMAVEYGAAVLNYRKLMGRL